MHSDRKTTRHHNISPATYDLAQCKEIAAQTQSELIRDHFSRYLPVRLCPSLAVLSLSFAPLPLLIYPPWHAHNVSSASSLTLHPTMHPPTYADRPLPRSPLHPPSPPWARVSEAEFIRNSGVLSWAITQKLALACKFKITPPTLSLSPPSSHHMLHPCVPSEPTLSWRSTGVES